MIGRSFILVLHLVPIIQIEAIRTAKQIKSRTVYLPDDLFERILVRPISGT